MMRCLSLLLAVPLLASCATAVADPVRTEQADARLQNLIAGKTAGQPVSCLPSYRSGSIVVVDGNTIAFRTSPNQVYVNNLRSGGCERLGGNYTMVTRTTGTGLCSGDIAQVADLTTGHVVGSCALGEFIPYNRPIR